MSNQQATGKFDLEKEHVFDVYDKIAESFSETRYKPWPKVKQFLDSLEDGCIVFDIGCGNGKYLNVNKNLLTIGSDTSIPLLEICRNKDAEVFKANCLCLPLRSNSGDACICIAVIHHLSSASRRIESIQEIVRVLKVGGKALIYVWAFEQKRNGKNSDYIKIGKSLTNVDEETNALLPVHCNRTEFKEQDVFVPFKSKKDSKSYFRYYHVFKEGELNELLTSVANITVLEIYYDNGNWCAIIQKIK
ncbi:hypothetical protein B4U80_02411 [Leptotrombidium deliense]|uniref:Methyltransferase type 11 domain-containing protein n=1 Tax=Leptotrombidium deliense TaxID=299467 RepID=A0A443STP3_9ACAR|nr:hypothetical protein B4U80_02411 [Leptotrombidium deliense]